MTWKVTWMCARTASALNERQLTFFPVQAAVESLLSRYSDEMQRFFKRNPEMLLMVSLRAKVAKAARQGETSDVW